MEEIASSRLINPSKNNASNNGRLKEDLMLLITNFIRHHRPLLSEQQIEQTRRELLQEVCDELREQSTTSKRGKTLHRENGTKLENVMKVNKAYLLRLKSLQINASNILACKRKCYTSSVKKHPSVGSSGSRVVNAFKKSPKITNKFKLLHGRLNEKSKPKTQTPTKIKLRKIQNEVKRKNALANQKPDNLSKPKREMKPNGSEIHNNTNQNKTATGTKIVSESAEIRKNLLRLESKNNYRTSKSSRTHKLDDFTKSFFSSITQSSEITKLDAFNESFFRLLRCDLVRITSDLYWLKERHNLRANK